MFEQGITRRQLFRSITIAGGMGVLSLVSACGQSDPPSAAHAGARQTPTLARSPLSGSATPDTSPILTTRVTALIPTAIVPPNEAPQLKPTLPLLIVTPQPSPSTPPPAAPYQRIMRPLLPAPDTARTVAEVVLILIGQVLEVLPPRWTTPDGQRPANPHSTAGTDSIFTPVRIAAKSLLKGAPATQEVLVRLPGGEIAADYVLVENALYARFQTGERTVLFLNPASGQPHDLQGWSLWEIWERYTIEGEQAKHPARVVPLQQLIAEITTATKATP